MTLKIRNSTIYTSDGEKLKEISCPLKMSKKGLELRPDSNFNCNECTETVVNTDYMTEDDITALLRHSPETCLYISLANPIFEVEQ